MNDLSSASGGGHGASQLHLLAAKGCSIAVSEFLAPSAGPNKRKRRPAGTPDPDAEVVALSPKMLMESDRYVCEICNQGFQRDQNLQMHRRRHKVPWKLLKKPSSLGTNKRVYICPERSCLHHDPTHALGDLVGIKKHYRRKHCTDKQWKCVKCSKRYAVQSDYKAHLKTCGTRGHCCDCGRVFSRVESFIEHQDTCSAAKRSTTQSNASLLHPNADRFISNVPSPSHSSDTTQAISFPQCQSTPQDHISTKLMDERPRSRTGQDNQEVHRSTATMPSWLITERRNNELELLPSMQGVDILPTVTPHSTEKYSIDHATHGSSRSPTANSCSDSKKDLIHRYSRCEEDMHTPCLRLSIGPTSSADEMVSMSCPSPHPSLDRSIKPRLHSSARKATLALSSHDQRQASGTGVLDNRSHPAAIGKDLALSIPEPQNFQTVEAGPPRTDHARWLSAFLAQAGWLKAAQVDSKGLYNQSMKKHIPNRPSEIMASYSPCCESTSTSSDHEARGTGHLHESDLESYERGY